MEDPITFDLWGRPHPAHRESVKSLLAGTRPGLSRIALLKELVATTHGGWLLIAEDQVWLDVQVLTAMADNIFESVRVYQCGWSPVDDDTLHLCATHALRHGGILGCQMCRGFARIHRPPL